MAPSTHVRRSLHLAAAALVVTALVTASAPAWAQVDDDRNVPYSGVTPQGGDPPTMPAPPAGFNFVTWPGFRTFSDGSSTVFLQLTGPVSYKTAARGRRIVITLEKAQVPLRNNYRRVITSHFKGTPVASFQLRKLKQDRVGLVITLRRGSKHDVSLKSAGRYNYLVVNFPPPFARSRAR